MTVKRKSLSRRLTSIAVLFCSIFMMHSLEAEAVPVWYNYTGNTDGCPYRALIDMESGDVLQTERLQGPCQQVNLSNLSSAQILTMVLDMELTWTDEEGNESDGPPESVVDELDVRMSLYDLYLVEAGLVEIE